MDKKFHTVWKFEALQSEKLQPYSMGTLVAKHFRA